MQTETQRKGDPCTLLVEMQLSTAIIENMQSLQKKQKHINHIPRISQVSRSSQRKLKQPI